MLTSPRVEFDKPADYHDEIAARADRVRFLAVPKRRYLMVDGTAKPGDKAFVDAIGTLYLVAYTLHFALKRRAINAPVGALEGLFTKEWAWKLMMRVPDQATEADVAGAIAEVKAKKRAALIDKVVCRAWEEGRAAQIMHVGPYSAEAATIQRLHDAIREAGLRPRGEHHEIYISDPNRTKAERVKTLIRQPVRAEA